VPRAGLPLLSGYYVASFAALGVYLPFFPRWLEARGIAGTAMGAVAALIPAIGLVGPPCFGILADVLGLRASLLRIASTGACLAFAAVALPAALGEPLGTVGLVVAVASFAFFRAPMVMLADVLTLERAPGAGTSYGRVRLWGSLGFLVSVMAAGRWLDPRAPAALPAAVAIALALAVAASFALPSPAERLDHAQGTSARRDPTPKKVRAGLRELLGSSDFRLFLAASVLGQAAHSAYDLTFSLHLRDLGMGQGLVGVTWALGVVAEIVLMAVAAPLLTRHGGRLLPVALLGASLRWALIASVRSHAVLIVLQPLHGFSFGLMWLASLHYVKERAPARILATAQGLYSATMAAGSVGGMLLWGSVYGGHAGATTFGAAAVVAGVAGVLAVLFARSKRTPPPEPSAPADFL
jgi:MFS transporter, PPP family, 3-phenylpropionic acid transporter